METISRSLLTFLLNSVWQIPLAAAVAALVCRLMRNGPARHRHAIWVAALAAAILLPVASVRTTGATAGPQYSASLAERDIDIAKPAAQRAGQAPAIPPAARLSRSISLAETSAEILLGAYLLFILFRLGQLLRALVRTLRIRRMAHAAALPERVERVQRRCLEAFGLTGVELRFSAEVPGPVTAGRMIILPASLRDESSEDVLTTAIGHEMAHIARRDFAGNLFYEVASLPVSFHPAAWLIRRGAQRTREMACDELVTRRLMDAGAYARSIVRIAAGMMALPGPGYTLGVFDGDVLEERIKRLVERPAANLKRARLLLAGGLAALVLCVVMASSLAVTARAQSAADGVIKQAEAVYNSGDHKQAITMLEYAVQLEPGSLKARLALADALMHEYVPGTNPADPFAAEARQRYLEVLSRDAANQQALHGMMMLATYSKQFAEAHEWAVKAIQANGRDKSAYYTAGFVDWAMTYPDYAAARTAAGMAPADPGIIPDAAQRENVRVQHIAQIEDGLHMLETALEIDPGYSDAMAYMNLLYRIGAGIADTPAQYADYIAKADDWVAKAMAVRRNQAENAATGKAAAPAATWTAAPTPPPLPPPPPPGGAIGQVPPDVVRVERAVQQARLVTRTPPVYPSLALRAGVSGVVRLSVLIAKDGTVEKATLISGPPLLVQAAIDAVQTWVYRPTLLNGVPVGVLTTVDVNFNPAGR